jgi:hypothetical protein
LGNTRRVDVPARAAHILPISHNTSHSPSPTHAARRRFPVNGLLTRLERAELPARPLQVPTPAATQVTSGLGSGPLRPPTPTARQVGQRRRREREREHARVSDDGLTARQRGQRARRACEQASTSASASVLQEPDGLTARQRSQRARRAREHAEREAQQSNTSTIPIRCPAALPTPPTTQRPPAPTRSVLDDGSLPLARRAYREPRQRHDLGQMDAECLRCHALHWVAERVEHREHGWGFGICCDHGIVQLPAFPDPPEELKQLLIGQDHDSREFRENIRQYNASLAFTSLGVQIDNSVNRRGSGPYIFRIHGELRHRSGSLLPSPGQQPAYAQLYIHDPREALNHRMARNPNLLRRTMEKLQTMLNCTHRYSTIYRHAFERLEAHPDILNLSLSILLDKDRDKRRYNLPTSDEVAVLIPGDETNPGGARRDIVLHRRDGPLQRLSDLNPAYPALHYALLFPHGSHGWHYEMRMHEPDKPKPRRLTQSRYYAYYLFERAHEFSTILRGGRLLQQFLVDNWAMTEQNRLAYLQQNQDTLRAALYSGLQDHLRASDEADLNALGQKVILPSSFTGSPRYMQQLFQDSLAIGRYCHSIDLFITVTANPKWPEIMRELKEGERPEDRPDITTRVFQLKKKAILEDILKNGIFGRTVAHVYTIEFQKRGLPHMHLLIFLDPRNKIRTPEDVDSCIRAYWPDPDTEPLLFATVQRCMVHGPCGELNPNAPCMENGKCTKGFPRPFSEETRMNAEGYPQYRTPDDGRKYRVGNHDVDNSWIIPYNAYLSAKYDCHINVQTSVSFAALKYITKYIHKGPDRATLQLEDGNEINKYLDSRYVSSCEAAFRLFHFDLHDHAPSVTRLQVSQLCTVCFWRWHSHAVISAGPPPWSALGSLRPR